MKGIKKEKDLTTMKEKDEEDKKNCITKKENGKKENRMRKK